MPKLKILAAVPLVVMAAGCANYYKVTDTSTGKVYYTQDVDKKGTAVEFKDAKSGAVTTLQNSQVLEIKKDAYKAGLAAPSTPPAAPAAVGAPAAPAAPAAAAGAPAAAPEAPSAPATAPATPDAPAAPATPASGTN